MATSSQDRRPRTESRSNPAIIPGVIALVLIVAAVAIAVMTKKDKTEVAPTTTERNPFADMPPEAAPPPKQHRPGSDLPPAPESVSTDPQWVAAKALGVEARELYEAAMNAKAKGDTATATTKGKAARAKYNEAVETTAVFEDDLMAKYNPYDTTVAAIHDLRSDWFTKLRFLEKSVGR